MKKYTEEEIAELGRAAIKRLAIKVYVVRYTHKHDSTVEVFGSRESAEIAAMSLMKDRVGESWCDEDIAKFQCAFSYSDQSELFHEIEKEVSYGELIQLDECTVQ